MKRLLLCIGLFFCVATVMPVQAQSIVDADDEKNFSEFYEQTLSKGKSAMPYAHLRESDVVWASKVWRTIDFREKFNQFFYFPVDPESNTQGRINLSNLIYKALSNGEIEVYEDDETKIPLDWETVNAKLNRIDSVWHEGEEDEYGELISEGYMEPVTISFESKDYFVARLKETWYIDKQDTRQKVRITGLALVYNDCRERGGEVECNAIERFWVPMQDMRVRNILAKYNAYDEHNDAAERSYDDVFIDRYFDSYVTRVSNRINRTISSYVTGTDAILEAQRIEEEIFNIESDMWEY